MAAFTLDTFGRRINLWCGCFMMIFSTILLIISGSLAMVLAARVIEGMSIGFLLLGYQVSRPICDDCICAYDRSTPSRLPPRRIVVLSRRLRS